MNTSPPYYKNTRQEVARFLPTRYQTVLEIGCGEGNFCASLGQRCEYWGVEPFQPAADVAARRLFKVLVGTYEQVFPQLPDSYFDLVICNDVIEHMADHDAFFLTIRQKMKTGSFMVGSIPNIRYLPTLINLLIGKEWAYKDEGVLDRTHLRFFTRRSLERTVIDHGFGIEELRGINGLNITPTSPTRLMRLLLTCVLGGDTRFSQFGFRIRYPASSASPPEPKTPTAQGSEGPDSAPPSCPPHV